MNYGKNKRTLVYRSKVRSISLILSYILIVSAYCILLTAYCLLYSCGKKGPPTLKSYETTVPSSQIESVDPNNVENTPEKSPQEEK